MGCKSSKPIAKVAIDPAELESLKYEVACARQIAEDTAVLSAVRKEAKKQKRRQFEESMSGVKEEIAATRIQAAARRRRSTKQRLADAKVAQQSTGWSRASSGVHSGSGGRSAAAPLTPRQPHELKRCNSSSSSSSSCENAPRARGNLEEARAATAIQGAARRREARKRAARARARRAEEDATLRAQAFAQGSSGGGGRLGSLSASSSSGSQQQQPSWVPLGRDGPSSPETERWGAQLPSKHAARGRSFAAGGSSGSSGGGLGHHPGGLPSTVAISGGPLW